MATRQARQYKPFGPHVGFRVQPKFFDLWLRNFLRKNQLSIPEFAEQIGEDALYIEMLAHPKRFKNFSPGDIQPSYRVLRAMRAKSILKVDYYERDDEL